jgi:hypothetical protein
MKYREVKHLLIVILLVTTLEGFAQMGLVAANVPATEAEMPSGIITGQVKTADDKPAAFVTVFL